jgi:hypothetical protein
VPLPAAAERRLAALGVTAAGELRFWEQIWDADGEEYFRLLVEKREADAAAFRRWSPVLREFAAECRRANPAPDPADFTPAEREQQRVLIDEMRKLAASGDGAVLAPRPFQVAVVTVPRVALAAAAERFGEAGAVILDAAEWDRWVSDVYPPRAEAFGWYVRAWWDVREGLPEGAEWVPAEYPLPPGSAYWLVTAGTAWGSLAGGATHDLWAWDGARATFLANYGVDSY